MTPPTNLPDLLSLLSQATPETALEARTLATRGLLRMLPANTDGSGSVAFYHDLAASQIATYCDKLAETGEGSTELLNSISESVSRALSEQAKVAH